MKLVLLAASIALAACSGSTSASTSSGSSSGTSSSASSGGTSASASSGSASSSAGSSGGASTSSSGGSSGSDPCVGNPVFCDDFTQPALAASYTEHSGTWTRAIGSDTVRDAILWDRAQSTLDDDASDFDVTLSGHTLGDDGFGLLYAAPSATEATGYAVLVHPAQFQGIYLKQLVAGQNDVNIAGVALPAGLAGTAMTVRIRREAGTVTAWLNGTQMLSASDGAPGASGRLGLLLSDTDAPDGGGAVFDLFRIDAASLADAGNPVDAGLPDAGSPFDAGNPFDAGSPFDAGAVLPSGNIAGPWTLIFDDEMNGNTLDTSKWSTGWFGSGITGGVSSSEDDCYDPAQVVESGGELDLNLIAKQEQCNGATKDYATGFVTTDGIFQYTFGFAEARIWLPGTGSIADWPSFWQDGTGTWPETGEDDILEGLSGSACYHFHDPAGGPGGCASGSFTGGWHTFASDWENGVVTYYYDGEPVGTVSSGVTSAPMYLILGLGVGTPAVAPASQRVDYVRVWQH